MATSSSAQVFVHDITYGDAPLFDIEFPDGMSVSRVLRVLRMIETFHAASFGNASPATMVGSSLRTKRALNYVIWYKRHEQGQRTIQYPNLS